MQFLLPLDLVVFLVRGNALQYEAQGTAAGAVVLKGVADLTVREVYVTAFDTEYEEEDTNFSGSFGYYVVPAISLVATRNGKKDDDNTLLWYPGYCQFGQWDREHNNAIRFENTTWNDIVADPIPYLDAKWTWNHPKAVVIRPWRDEHYDFREGETPW